VVSRIDTHRKHMDEPTHTHSEIQPPIQPCIPSPCTLTLNRPLLTDEIEVCWGQSVQLAVPVVHCNSFILGQVIMGYTHESDHGIQVTEPTLVVSTTTTTTKGKISCPTLTRSLKSGPTGPTADIGSMSLPIQAHGQCCYMNASAPTHKHRCTSSPRHTAAGSSHRNAPPTSRTHQAPCAPNPEGWR